MTIVARTAPVRPESDDPSWRAIVWLCAGAWACAAAIHGLANLALRPAAPELLLEQACTKAAGFALTFVLCVAARATNGWAGAQRSLTLVLATAMIIFAQTKVVMFVEAYFKMERLSFHPENQTLHLIDIVLWYCAFFIAPMIAYLVMERAAVIGNRERELGVARREFQAAQVESLRHQLNPHFLLNSLNSISSLILTRRREDANRMITRLGEFLQASLTEDARGPVQLDHELATASAYLSVERVRFGDRFTFLIRCPEALHKAAIPGFLLQPILENAIKYAVAPSMGHILIVLTARADGDDLILTVEDNAQASRPRSTYGGGGLGLKSVAERLRILHGARASVSAMALDVGFCVEIRLPLVEVTTGR